MLYGYKIVLLLDFRGNVLSRIELLTLFCAHKFMILFEALVETLGAAFLAHYVGSVEERNGLLFLEPDQKNC